jgi:hypothetical protein
MSALFCLVRRKRVPETPEEFVRQKLLHHMIHELGFPREMIAVEKSLASMPHLEGTSSLLPERRADIVTFRSIPHTLTPLPLLLVECKAVPINEVAIRQVIGYNHYLAAPYLCLANREEIHFGAYDPEREKYRFIRHIPPYSSLLASLSINGSSSIKKSRDEKQ